MSNETDFVTRIVQFLTRLPKKYKGTIRLGAISSTYDGEGEIVAQIRKILDEDIRPYVAADGGEITFAGYRDGVVEVYMQGACSGCPSSTATLKQGIEARLREEISEVEGVVAL